uniref:Uncharacterized protein n=1 Tax=Arundo donax TaxID=35708 RepID=A0A0A9EUM4_ARUDO
MRRGAAGSPGAAPFFRGRRRWGRGARRRRGRGRRRRRSGSCRR